MFFHLWLPSLDSVWVPPNAMMPVTLRTALCRYWATGGGGGAGFSLRFQQPEYQRSTVQSYLASTKKPATSVFDGGKRAFPDVSALAMGGIPSVIAVCCQ